MLKVAVITRYFPSELEPWQGRSAYETLCILARSADVHVFHCIPAYPAGLKGAKHRAGSNRGEDRRCPVDVSYYTFPALPVLSRPFNGVSVARTVLQDLASFAPDIILGCFLYPDGYAAVKIGRALSVPAVVMALGSDVNRIGDSFTARQTKWTLGNSDFVVTVSKDLRRKALALGARIEATRTVMNGCEPSVFYVRSQGEARLGLGIDPSAKVILYVGRLDVEKGLRELVQAAITVHKIRPDVQTYMVGEGPDRQTIQNEIEANHAHGYVHLNPPCGFNEVAQWMAASDLVTLPSYMEGCPNVIREALACGRPVVATEVGGIPEMVTDQCGRFVKPRDSENLARALLTVLDRKWDPQAISAQCSRSWETVADELLAIFQSLIPKHKGCTARGR